MQASNVIRIFAAVILLGGLIGYVIYARGPSAQSLAESAVRAKVKDPDSVQFRKIRYSDSTKSQVCGEFNAKNAFGGYAGFRRFVYHSDSVAIENADPNFEMWWGLYCD